MSRIRASVWSSFRIDMSMQRRPFSMRFICSFCCSLKLPLLCASKRLYSSLPQLAITACFITTTFCRDRRFKMIT